MTADPSGYEVHEATLRELFDDHIRDFVFDAAAPTHGNAPTVVMLGGQLGAGKSHALASVLERHGGSLTPFSPDDLRAFHPLFDDIMREHPHELVPLTAQAVRSWSQMVHEHAHERGYGLVIEGSFGRPPARLKVVDQLARRPASGVHPGFRAEVVAIAVNEYRSRLDMVGRYLTMPTGLGRWSEAPGHDRTYRMVPQTVEALEANPHVERVIVTDRVGTVHYDNARGADGAWRSPPRAAHVLREARSEGRVPFDQAEAARWLSAYWAYNRQLLERGELNAVTAETMLVLHADADKVAPIAYVGQTAALARHERWQGVQKAVLLAGSHGVDNALLPPTPEAFLTAEATKQQQFAEAVAQADPHTPSEEWEAAREAVRRARQGLVPPSAGTDSAPPRARTDSGPGTEPSLER
ncbi:zeta toxin family protein [Streptomonospora nanhaiensis]|uniref:zeta toxin family protein n=1 Tax=Streptomonospora nanhaiensis TaxID=1323731 RepID=UPI001C9912E7|nr:zeta toxin family protein [Streptomonospora nanhaiensis]MBX9388148.1 zeta toxin family protein [Streptomonospora nanhaiensis]